MGTASGNVPESNISYPIFVFLLCWFGLDAVSVFFSFFFYGLRCGV